MNDRPQTSRMDRSQVDLTNCDTEPIQFAGHIQDHGHLIALDPATLTVTYASHGAAALFGEPELLGLSIDRLDARFESEVPGPLLRDLIQVAQRNGTYTSSNPNHARLAGMDFDLVLHHNGQQIVAELEHKRTDVAAMNVQTVLGHTMVAMQKSADIPTVLQRVAEQVKGLIGYDRVMVYRFWEDWHGEVLAEAKNDDLEPFLGLHYPASDIPKQARALYEINLTRLIADVNGAVVPIEARTSAPLDLTHAQLRAVSPIHLEYLRNMGVKASFSISILYKDRLWGLIACHNNTPRTIDYASRNACSLIARFLSATIELKTDEEARLRDLGYMEGNARLKEQLHAHMDVALGLAAGDGLLSINDATGAALCFEGKVHVVGAAPDENAIRTIREWLMRMRPERLFQTTNLSAALPVASAYQAIASGLLSATLSNDLGEYILWFKPELVQTVTWAGKPEKVMVKDANDQVRLSPRKSFEKWSEEVRATSAAWEGAEVHAAGVLRDTVLALISQKAHEIRRLNEKLRLAYSELDTFSFSISHDLKTPLNTVRGYIELFLEDTPELRPEGRKLLENALANTDKMLVMIRDILEYAKMGRVEVEPEPILLAPMLNEVRELVANSRGFHGIELQVDDRIVVHGKPVMVYQVLANLMDNAVKYSARRPDPKVSVKALSIGNETVVEVCDNGVGMDPRSVHKAFDLFHRLDNVHGYEGTGVGLAIVKRIMERHDGRIWIESALDEGTRVSVSFPDRTTDEKS